MKIMAIPDRLTLEELDDGDPLIRWVAQGFGAGVRAWCAEGAVAVASPSLSGRDRLAVTGPEHAAAGLVAGVLREIGPSFRPIGDQQLIGSLARRVAGLELVAPFLWMQSTMSPARPGIEGLCDAAWLSAGDEDEIEQLLLEGFPTSYARPGVSGVRRWCGARDESGALAALTAEAWSVPTVGFLAGVAAMPAGRGKGYARAAFTFALHELIREHGQAALIVDADNVPAIRLYERCGMQPRSLAAAAVCRP